MFKKTTKTFDTITAGLSAMVADLLSHATDLETKADEDLKKAQELNSAATSKFHEATKAQVTAGKLQDLLGISPVSAEEVQ